MWLWNQGRFNGAHNWLRPPEQYQIIIITLYLQCQNVLMLLWLMFLMIYDCKLHFVGFGVKEYSL